MSGRRLVKAQPEMLAHRTACKRSSLNESPVPSHGRLAVWIYPGVFAPTYNGSVADSLPSPVDDDTNLIDWTAQIVPIARVAHGLWIQPAERRRLRAFGFRPSAREDGVLKREWHGADVRVSPEGIRFSRKGLGELQFDADTAALTFNDAPFTAGPGPLEAADGLVSLINDYERWLEAREGRAVRLERTRSVTRPTDPRPTNAIAETRRLQRLLGTAWGRPPTRRR